MLSRLAKKGSTGSTTGMRRTFITITLYLFMACMGHGASELKPKSSNATFGRLADHLMDGYNKGVRPVQNWNQATNVTIHITIFAILGVDEKNQALTTYIWCAQSWIDEFLTWDLMKFENVTKISIPTQWVWVPDITIVECLSMQKSDEISYVHVYDDGRVVINEPVHIVTACKLNIYYFPFDVQNCSLTFTSWGDPVNDINVHFWKNEHVMEALPFYYDTDGEWDLVKVIHSHREFVVMDDKRFSQARFFIVMKRRTMFYTVNVILPSIFLMILDIVGFYLPPESGERVSFKITLLLGYSVFLSYASDQLPATGTPLIGVYFIICMLMMVISIMESILMVRIVHNQNLHPAVSKWLKKLVFGKMSLLVCLKDWVHRVAPREDSSEQTESITEKLAFSDKDDIDDDYKQLPMARLLELLLSIQNEVVSIQKHLKKQDNDSIIMEWLQIGYIVDKFLFRVYLVVMLVYAAVLATIWAQWYWQRTLLHPNFYN
ncbi:5-hydroxytryptamine receptor 3A-like isoform X2 [Hyperolius riggenbachi]|uniref:5-hydroxytryptamine receptor 3A-like isoform X2 n=1 Tax=Hyperolius riggenbachi TaxID=752182 RepID=UPI0035A3647F